MASKKNKSRRESKGVSSKTENIPKYPQKRLPNKRKESVKAYRSYPWALFADCLLILFFLFSNGWNFKLEIQLYFVIAAGIIFFATMFNEENRSYIFNGASWILLVLLAQCLLYFVGLFYAVSAKFALQQFYLNAGALFVFATAYISFRKSEHNFGRFFSAYSGVVTLATLFSIELATSGLMKGFVFKIAGILQAQVANNYAVFETNTRMTTVLGSPNVFAPMAVLGIFLSLWSCCDAGERNRNSLTQMWFAIVCGIGFVLCFSLGTILSYAVVLLIYMIVVPKGEKGAQLFRHAYCMVISLVGAGIVFVLKSVSILPIISVIALSLLAAFAYTRMKPIKLPVAVLKRGWLFIPAGTVALVALIICAVVFRGPYSMDKGEAFKRAVALNPGTYTLQTVTEEAAAPASLTVDISSQSYEEASLKIKTQLARETIQQGQSVEFTVPDASAAVFMTFTAQNDIMLKDAVIADGFETIRLPLRYKLVPEFIVNRLQGLWVNDNAIQRFIFFRDGIRLGMRSPIIGLGGGTYEGGVFSVADYYYQTKHPHNELIQRFIDGGIIGLLLFVALAFSIFRALYKARKNNKVKPMLAVLFACMTMVFIHSLIEVDFLMISFRIVASILFAATAVISGDDIELKKRGLAAYRVSFALIITVTVYLSGGRYIANKMLDREPTLKTLQNAMWIDPCNKTDYMLSYLISTAEITQPDISDYQNKYLDSLDGKITGADLLAKIHLTRNQPDGVKGTKAAELYIHERRVDPSAWNMILSLYHSVLNNATTDIVTRNAVEASAHRLLDYLDELNRTLPLAISPDPNLLSVVRTSIGRQ